jgi:L-seryl-tRNA(Ser) seleniumtransferase
VTGAVFKTVERQDLSLAGSIPVRLRHPVTPLTLEPVMVDPRRQIPRTDVLLASPRFVKAAARLGPALVKAAVLAAQQRARAGEIAPSEVADAAAATLPTVATSLQPVINATGVVVHTNLGRAPLSAAAREALVAAAGATDVEFDLASGARARRGRGTLAALAEAVPDAGGVHVVNNNAAALLLCALALAPAGREIVISRGELVEIGDGFRIPDLLTSAGARLREVGTTNRVDRRDYAAAVGPDTGFVLKVHPSNFRITGFTSTVDVAELVGLGAPVVVDIGSGLLSPHPLLPDEPDAASALRAGASLVTASGDKLLGGPQAGLLLGESSLVDRLRRHPAARALRVDKLTLAALEATLRGPQPPVAEALTVPQSALYARASRLAGALTAAGIDAAAVSSVAAVGGGGAPGVELPSAAVSLPAAYAQPLRIGAMQGSGPAPVVGRVEHGRCLLDLRTVDASDDDRLLEAVRAVGSA